MSSFLVTLYIEEGFDSLDHLFLILVLKNYGFGSYFISWIETLSKTQRLCVTNGGVTTQCFKLEKHLCHGDPVSDFLFIFALDILFLPYRL